MSIKPTRDVSMLQRPNGGGMDHSIKFMCGHKPASKIGGTRKGGIWWLCAACAKEPK